MMNYLFEWCQCRLLVCEGRQQLTSNGQGTFAAIHTPTNGSAALGSNSWSVGRKQQALIGDRACPTAQRQRRFSSFASQEKLGNAGGGGFPPSRMTSVGLLPSEGDVQTRFRAHWDGVLDAVQLWSEIDAFSLDTMRVGLCTPALGRTITGTF